MTFFTRQKSMPEFAQVEVQKGAPMGNKNAAGPHNGSPGVEDGTDRDAVNMARGAQSPGKGPQQFGTLGSKARSIATDLLHGKPTARPAALAALPRELRGLVESHIKDLVETGIPPRYVSPPKKHPVGSPWGPKV